MLLLVRSRSPWLLSSQAARTRVLTIATPLAADTAAEELKTTQRGQNTKLAKRVGLENKSWFLSQPDQGSYEYHRQYLTLGYIYQQRAAQSLGRVLRVGGACLIVVWAYQGQEQRSKGCLCAILKFEPRNPSEAVTFPPRIAWWLAS